MQFKFLSKTYNGFSDFVKAYPVESRELQSRLSNGEDLESVLKDMEGKLTPHFKESLNGTITLSGKSYNNLDKACLAIGVDKDLINDLVINKKLSIQYAFEAAVSSQPITVLGTAYTIEELSREYKISVRDLVSTRLTTRSWEKVISKNKIFHSPLITAHNMKTGLASAGKGLVSTDHGSLITIPTRANKDTQVEDKTLIQGKSLNQEVVAIETSNQNKISSDIFAID